LYIINFVGTIASTAATLPLFDMENGGSTTYSNFATSALHTLGDVTLCLSIFVADITMSWRMWIIWSKEWKVLIFPGMILSTGLVGAGFIITYDCIGIADHADSYEIWSESMIAITAILNTYLTAMTCGKLWWVSRKVRKICPASQTSGRYSAFIGAVIEAGAFYTLSAVMFTILLHVSLDGRFIFQSIFVNATVMAPTLVLLKLSMGYLQPGDSVANSVPSNLLKNNTSLNAPSSRQRRDDLSCDLSDLDSRDNTSQMTESKDFKIGTYDLSSPTTTLEGRDSRMEIYVDTKANTSIV